MLHRALPGRVPPNPPCAARARQQRPFRPPCSPLSLRWTSPRCCSRGRAGSPSSVVDRRRAPSARPCRSERPQLIIIRAPAAVVGGGLHTRARPLCTPHAAIYGMRGPRCIFTAATTPRCVSRVPRSPMTHVRGGAIGRWNKRWFVLRDNVLMYFQAPRDFLGFRDKPNGVVLLDECNVRPR